MTDTEFETRRLAHIAAMDDLMRLIDYPDKSLPLDEYRARLAAAQAATRVTHDALMDAWRP
jgi:hypothetical protein